MPIITLQRLPALRSCVPASGECWSSSFLCIVQVHPRLDVLPIAETCIFLRFSKLFARIVSPPAFAKKRIPDGNFFVAGPPTMGEAPFEDFLVRSALQRSLHKLLVIHSEKSCATRVEVGVILNACKIVRRQLAGGLQTDLVHHPGKI